MKTYTETVDLIQKYCKIVGFILSLPFLCSQAFAAEGITWGRFWVQPALTLTQAYSDNIFLDDDDNKISDTIIMGAPELASYIALTPDNRIGLHYKGYFYRYSDFDNFGNTHEGEVTWSYAFPAGSTIEIGSSLLETSIQPYDEFEKEKPYSVLEVFADSNFKPGAFNEIGLNYTYSQREFDSGVEDEEKDNYDRNEVRIDYVNSYFPRLPLLLEYRYSINNKEYNPASNSRSNAIYTGARWTPETRLSGKLRIGYQYTDYDDIDDVSLIVVDTTLNYKISDITSFRLKAIRRLKDSIQIDEKEAGNNYIFTILEGHFTYNYTDPLTLSLDLTYEKKDYEEDIEREDDLYSVRTSLEYSVSSWAALYFSYKFRENFSTLETEEYKENTVYGGVIFSL